VAGRGFDARISTEFAVELPDSACVYCGNCIAVCPTGALMPSREHELRLGGEWKPEAQTVTRTVCPYCGVGCNLELVVQDNEIVRVNSPDDHDITRGNLCVKGRFGFQHVHPKDDA
jgi:NADP-reducing hydrogenase subunit HndD